MKWLSLLLTTVFVGVALAGCTSPDDTTPTTEPTVVTPTPPDDTMGDGIAQSISITQSAATATGAEGAQVCWSIGGTGNVAHVAVHYDTTSHAGSDVTFADYAAGAVYPDNTAALDAAGYDLPGEFCATITTDTAQTLYYRAHVIDSNGAPGIVSAEAQTVFANAGQAPGGNLASGIRITSSPAQALISEAARVCWAIEGTGTVGHIAIHYDDLSHPGDDVVFADYAGGAQAVYPDNTAELDPAGYPLPGEFCANLPTSTTGTLWYRAHVIDDTGAPGSVSAEAHTAIADDATVYAIVARAANPTQVPVGETATLCMHLHGNGIIPHAAVHYDNVSHNAANVTFSDYANTLYPTATGADNGSYNTAQADHCVGLAQANAGIVYYRFHTLDGNGDQVLSPEYKLAFGNIVETITITASASQAASGTASQVCWNIAGYGRVGHVAVHYDYASHGDGATFADYAGGALAIYPDDAAQLDPAGYALPATYCGTLSANNATTLWYRAHAIDDLGAPGTLSAETHTAFAANGTVTHILPRNNPTTATAGQTVSLCMHLHGFGIIPHASAHYDTISHLGNTTIASDYASTTYATPDGSDNGAYDTAQAEHCVKLSKSTPGTLYYRFHTVDSQGTAVLSDEYAVVFS